MPDRLQLVKMLQKRSRFELRKPQQLSQPSENYGSVKTSNFLPERKCTVPWPLVFPFTIARPGLPALRMVDGLLYSNIVVSKLPSEFGGKIEWAMTRGVVVRWAQTVALWMRCSLYVAFNRLDTFSIFLPIVYLFVFFLHVLCEGGRSNALVRLWFDV